MLHVVFRSSSASSADVMSATCWYPWLHDHLSVQAVNEALQPGGGATSDEDSLPDGDDPRMFAENMSGGSGSMGGYLYSGGNEDGAGVSEECEETNLRFQSLFWPVLFDCCMLLPFGLFSVFIFVASFVSLRSKYCPGR